LADATAAVAGKVVGAAVKGAIGGIQGAANGIRDGWRKGSLSVAGRPGQAWVKGVIGGIQGAANGIRDGWSTGSQSRRPPRWSWHRLVADVVTWPLGVCRSCVAPRIHTAAADAGRPAARIVAGLIPGVAPGMSPTLSQTSLLAWHFPVAGRGCLMRRPPYFDNDRSTNWSWTSSGCRHRESPWLLSYSAEPTMSVNNTVASTRSLVGGWPLRDGRGVLYCRDYMCATIAAMAVQITRTQIATAMAADISDIVSSFTFMISCSVRFVAVLRAVQPDGDDH
jgi:hypothetical protein